MARVLITGAAGFVGRHLAKAMAPHHEVFGLGRSTRPKEFPSEAEWIEHDLNEAHLPAHMPKAIDCVYHLAQSRRFRDAVDGARDIVGVNLQSTAALMFWAHGAGARKFVFTSTGGLCGSSDKPIMEDAPYRSSDVLGLYFASKYSSELLLSAYTASLASVVVRPFFVYGAGQDPTMLVARIIERVRNGEPIQLQGGEGIKINPIYISDCVRALERAGEIDGSHLLNLAGPEVISLRRLAETVGSRLGRNPVFQTDYAARANHVVGDIGLMATLLGPPRIGFAQGLGDFVDPLESQNDSASSA